MRNGKPSREAITHKYYRWAELLKRVFAFAVLICDHRQGPRRILAFLTEPRAVRAILQHCGIAEDDYALAPARSPPGYVDEFFA